MSNTNFNDDLVKEAYDVIAYIKNGLDYLTKNEKYKELQNFERVKSLREIKQVLKYQSIVLSDISDNLEPLEEIKIYSKKDDNEVSIPKLLLSQASVGDTFQEIQYYSILEQTEQNLFYKIEKLKNG